MPISPYGQQDYQDPDGKAWTFVWGTLQQGWSIQQVLMIVRSNCVRATNATQTWLDTLHAIGESKMYSITTPRNKNVDEIAAHWLATLRDKDKIGYYRAFILVRARPTKAAGVLIFSCHAVTRGQLIRMTVEMGARIRPEKPAPIWTPQDTVIEILDTGAAKNERAMDPAIGLLHDCVTELAPWAPENNIKREGIDDKL